MNSTPSRTDIEFYFDPVSPYAWLASTQLEKLSNRTACKIIPRPILFAGLLNAHGHIGPAEIPAKRDYIFRDVMRRAQYYGLKFEGTPNHPFNPLLALRICTAIENDRARLQFTCRLLNAAWSNGEDITCEQTMIRLVTDSGHDAVWAIEASQNPKIKNELFQATRDAVESGIFGVPTFRVDGQLFWGDDRIDDVIGYLNGDRIDENKLAAMLATAPAARRK